MKLQSVKIPSIANPGMFVRECVDMLNVLKISQAVEVPVRLPIILCAGFRAGHLKCERS